MGYAVTRTTASRHAVRCNCRNNNYQSKHGLSDIGLGTVRLEKEPSHAARSMVSWTGHISRKHSKAPATTRSRVTGRTSQSIKECGPLGFKPAAILPAIVKRRVSG